MRAALAVVLLLVVGVFATQQGPIPAFFWSGSSSVFSGQNVPVLEHTNVLPFLEHTVVGRLSPATRNYFSAESPCEVVFVFVHDQLRTDQISRFSFAHDKKAQQTRSSFATLKDRMENSPSSLVIPYSFRSSTSLFDDLSAVASQLLSRSPSSRIVLSHGADVLHPTLVPLLAGRTAVQVHNSRLQDYLSTANLFNDNTLDLVVVQLDSLHTENAEPTDDALRSKFASDDAFLATIDATARRLSHDGNYAMVVTGSAASPSSALRLFDVPAFGRLAMHAEVLENFERVGAGPYVPPSTPVYIHMDPPTLEMILIFLFLAIIIYNMSCSLAVIQSPEKFYTQLNKTKAQYISSTTGPMAGAGSAPPPHH